VFNAASEDMELSSHQIMSIDVYQIYLSVQLTSLWLQV